MNTSNVDASTSITVPAASPLPSSFAKKPRAQKWVAFWRSDFLKLSLWLALHAALGVACANFAPISQLHSVLVLAVGLWFALQGIRLERVVYVCGYLIGAEVIWRMTGGTFFYEYGKYALALICIAAIVRNGMFRGTPLAICYFVLLLPSLVLPSAYVGDTDLRKMISFNLSGPLALTVSLWMLSQITLKKDHIGRLLLCLLSPTISVACIAAYRLMTSESVFFGRSSSKVGSGGFGPNQVSATLGLGILAALLFVIIEKRERLLKFFLFALMAGLGAQAALTFSRTGLYLSALSSFIALLCLAQDRKMRMRLVAVVAAVLVVGNFLLLPRLNQFTDGALSERFQNTNSSNRVELFFSDLRLWAEYPVFGSGPGFKATERSDLSDNVASHTEYSRMLAEHGTFGLFSLFALIAVCVLNLRRTHSPQQRAVVFSFMCWALLFMTVSAMRLAAPAFLLGLTSATWAFIPRAHAEKV